MDAPTGFTAIYCGANCCPSTAGGPDVVPRLRETVRRCPHGVLVRGECVLGLLASGGWPVGGTCRQDGGAGAFVIIQPCRADRKALGAASVAGPLHEDSDIEDLCHWLVDGLPTRTPLPEHLRPTVVAGNHH